MKISDDAITTAVIVIAAGFAIFLVCIGVAICQWAGYGS